ncbi:MAG: hypothetical protein O9296_01855 [Novosphingobium sp.]|nr:hypothetical protein [Novosphingobium sp.]
MTKKKPLAPHDQYAADHGLTNLPPVHAVRAAIHHVASQGEDPSNRAVAAHLRSEGYECPTTWLAKLCHHERISRSVVVATIREGQYERARALSDVIDLRPLFGGTEAVKGLTAHMIAALKEKIDNGTFPWPEDPKDMVRLIETLALLDRSASEAAKTNVETAVMVPGALADSAKDVTAPRRGRFAALFDD